ncbi:MAG: hypothetical protein QM216_02825, partial [Bacillota bacterium]|nr:hypothetical protein [Bacillota bacterium]
VSAAYKTAIKKDVRDMKITGTITLKDSSVINVADEDIAQGSLYFTEQCVSGEDIEIGNVYASELGLALTSPPENPYSLDGARIIINFGINVEPDTEEDPIWEYVPLGYFYVTEIERKQTTVNLKALDGLILFDVDLSGVLTTGTPYALIQSCCTKAGVTLATSSGDFADFANGLSPFTVPDESKIETCRDLIMWICQLTGTFARMNREGQLEVIPVTAGSSVKTISKPERFTSDVSDFEVKVTKVAMKLGEEEYSQGTDGMTMVLEENPLLVGKSEAEINAALAEILAQVTEAEYTPYNLTGAGDPALQAGDWITLTDTGTLTGGDVESIVTHTSWRYRGPHEIKAVGKSGLLRGVMAQQQKAVSSIRTLAKAAQDLAQAANQSTQLINDAIGGHVLIRREPGGTNEILIMDNPDPELATKIWRWNLGGLGYSDNVVGADNPAREYDVAMTMDGAINANFITTGKLVAGVVQIGAGTTFATGYDPSEKETPSGAQQKADAAASAAEQAAKDYTDTHITYKVDIFSTGGLVFKNGVISTTLIARVYKGKEDITDQIDSNYFRWTRISDDPAGDEIWNDANYGGSKQIVVTQDDVFARATFVCEILEFENLEDAS